MTSSCPALPVRRRLALGLALALASFGTCAAKPDAGWSQGLDKDGVPRLLAPGIDLPRVQAEDRARHAAGAPLRYAIPMGYEVDIDRVGLWDSPQPGTLRWRLRIASPDAVSINLGFTKYRLPQGARLRVLDRDGLAQFRAFTAADNEAHGELWTPPVRGDEVLLELTLAAAEREHLRLSLTSINHGYLLLGQRPKHLKSGACNVDVICPQGDDWRDQIRSSATISTGGSTFCSGALINNTAFDSAPLFLTANHCGINAGNAASLVTFWNYENSTCRPPGSPASGAPGDGQLDEFNTGSIFRAANAATDFTLVELDDAIPDEFEPYWSGWDRGTNDFAAAIAIHHPNTDEKRISFEDQATTTTSYLGEVAPGDGSHIRVIDWDLGTTEPGSSGSPLYSPQKRIVGQLHGGFAACGNDDSDWYGRLSGSWTGAGTDSTRLSTWLDPGGTGATFIDGSGGAPFDVSVTPNQIDHCVATEGNQVMASIGVAQAEPGFTDPVTLSALDAPSGTSTGFGTNPVTPPGSSSFTLGNLDAAASGTYTIALRGDSGADSDQAPLALDLSVAAPGQTTLLSPADGATNVPQPVALSWQAVPGAGRYRVEVFQAPPPAAPVHSQEVAGTNVVVLGLTGGAPHAWRVTAINHCGDGIGSALRSFTPIALQCELFSQTPNLPIGPDLGDQTVATLAVSGLGESIQSVQVVGLRGTHTYTGDLDVSLRSPAGTTRILFEDQCGTAENFHLTLDDDASAAIACPLGDPTASPQVARPTNALSVFDTEDPNGNWVLTILDDANQDEGILQGWGLQVCTEVVDSVTAVNDAYATSEDSDLVTAADTGVLDNDSATGGTLGATLLSPPGNGTLVGGLGSDGAFTYRPNANYCGSDAFSYTASNGSTSDTADVAITIACVNDPPQFDGSGYSFSVDERSSAGTVVGTVPASDVEGAVTYSISAGNTGGAFAIDSTGVIRVSSAAAVTLANSPFSLTITATDSALATADIVVPVSVDNVNDAPVTTAGLPEAFASVGNPVDIDAGAVFDDPDGDTLTYSMSGNPASLSIDPATGRITGTPTQVGSSLIQVRATDPSNASVSTSFTLNIRPVPVFADGFED
jgi:lysyl endopeptidase